MVKRLKTRLPVAILVVALACNERNVSSPPPPTQPPGKPVGVLIGTVSGDSLTATFVPASGSLASPSALEPAIYGGSTTANVFGTNTAFTTTGSARTWTFKVAMRNLLAFAIGTNYTSSAPLDTSGVFLFFTQTPVVTNANPCNGCVVNVTNAMGTRNFTAPGQQYFWYRSRPTAVQGTIGTDTTADDSWTFRTTSVTAPDTVHSFTFVLLVSAMWPPPNETTWQVLYDGKNDTFPDKNAEPIWQLQTLQGHVGKETWSPLSGLEPDAHNKNEDIDYTRRDSLGAMDAYMDVNTAVLSGTNGELANIFGFIEPDGRVLMVGVSPSLVEFAQIDSLSTDAAFNQWLPLSGSSSVAASGSVKYRLRKFARDSVVLCVNGARSLELPYTSFQPVSSNLPANVTTFFGVQSISKRALGLYTLATYTIGTTGGGCS
jgi:hypothetical protein